MREVKGTPAEFRIVERRGGFDDCRLRGTSDSSTDLPSPACRTRIRCLKSFIKHCGRCEPQCFYQFARFRYGRDPGIGFKPRGHEPQVSGRGPQCFRIDRCVTHTVGSANTSATLHPICPAPQRSRAKSSESLADSSYQGALRILDMPVCQPNTPEESTDAQLILILLYYSLDGPPCVSGLFGFIAAQLVSFA